VSFQEAADGTVLSMTAHIEEDSVRRGDPRDIVGTPVRVDPLSAAALAAYAGRYESPELGVVYRIAVHDGALMLEHPRLGRLPMLHRVEDTFSIAGRGVTRIEFHRGGDGAVTGFTGEAYAWGATAEFDRLAAAGDDS
jgi:hypothetical protein